MVNLMEFNPSEAATFDQACYCYWHEVEDIFEQAVIKSIHGHALENYRKYLFNLLERADTDVISSNQFTVTKFKNSLRVENYVERSRRETVH